MQTDFRSSEYPFPLNATGFDSVRVPALPGVPGLSNPVAFIITILLKDS
ncbi:hypothetical protein [Planomicrobium sp. YIM 101495]|nr:hypothetical protein [Planomicrobium sp. YIM 101495]MTD32268.1 hypothetical protein [Planomicrobium sp. YIM 101495]